MLFHRRCLTRLILLLSWIYRWRPWCFQVKLRLFSAPFPFQSYDIIHIVTLLLLLCCLLSSVNATITGDQLVLEHCLGEGVFGVVGGVVLVGEVVIGVHGTQLNVGAAIQLLLLMGILIVGKLRWVERVIRDGLEKGGGRA